MRHSKPSIAQLEGRLMRQIERYECQPDDALWQTWRVARYLIAVEYDAVWAAVMLYAAEYILTYRGARFPGRAETRDFLTIMTRRPA